MKKNQEKFKFTFNGKTYTIRNNSIMYYMFKLKPIFIITLISLLVGLFVFNVYSDTKKSYLEYDKCMQEIQSKRLCTIQTWE